MDLDAVVPCHEAEHVVAIDRVAAFCHLVVEALEILCVDDDVVLACTSVFPCVLEPFRSCCLGAFRSLGIGLGHHLVMVDDIILDDIDVQASVPDCGVESVQRGEVVFLVELCHHVVRELQLPVLQPSVQQLLAFCSLFVERLIDGLADFAPCL